MTPKYLKHKMSFYFTKYKLVALAKFAQKCFICHTRFLKFWIWMPLDSPYLYRWPFFPQPTSLFATFGPGRQEFYLFGPSLTIWNISGMFPWFLETTYFRETNAYFFSHSDLTPIVHSIRVASNRLWRKLLLGESILFRKF